MSRRLALYLIIAAAWSGAALAKQSAPETLTRTSKWVVNYDKDACHLLAQFGTGKDVLAMRLTRYEPGDPFDLGLYGGKLASGNIRSEAKIDFGLRGTPVDADATNGTAGRMPLMLFGSTRLDGWQRTSPEESAPSLSTQQEAAVTGVTIRIERRKPFRLEFGSLAKPMEQLRRCQTDLVKSWGYDPVIQTTLARPARPLGSASDWLRSSDYPVGAMDMGQNGIVQFRVDVDEAGKVAGCHVLARTSPDVFADTTCRAVSRRAKLAPALDAGGKPVRSFYVQKVRWQAAN